MGKFKVGQKYRERGGMLNVVWTVTHRNDRVTSNGTRVAILRMVRAESAKGCGRIHNARVRLNGKREACVGRFCGTITA
jgi:hypothetical protein